MKRLTALLLAVVLMFFCGSCRNSGKEESSSGVSSLQSSVEGSSGETSSEEGASSLEDNGQSGTSSDTVSSRQSSSSQSKVTSGSVTTSSERVIPPSSVAPPVTSAPVSSEVKPKTVRVTIPEGYTFTQIASLLEQKGVCSKKSLLDTVNSYDYSYYPWIAKIKNPAERCFKLEGYLYPDTYEFYIGEKPQDALGRMLRVSKVKITAQDEAKAASMGFTMDQVLTVASIIQKEVKNQDMSKAAAVIYNRMKIGQRLECDVTIDYIEKHVKPYLTGDINRYNAKYNTYKCAALPSGPICNPGRAAINAALNPSAEGYLYFIADPKTGVTYFNTTYEDHMKKYNEIFPSSSQEAAEQPAA